MTIQISNIVLWQKNGEIRNLELKRNSVNVITGDSGKGKSSVLHIIDYCLLSTKAKGISKSTIDDKVDWYGLKIFTRQGVIAIARKAYHKDETDKVYFNDSGILPEIPVLNMKISSLKKVLNKEFGIDSDLKIPYGGRTVKAGSKISFRQFLGYCYQDQNAIVSPEYLYIRPGDIKFLERIERTFRVALGVTNIEGAIVGERLKKLIAKKESLERRTELLSKKTLDYEEDVVSLEEEAVSLGLLDKISDDVSESLSVLADVADSPLERFSNSNELINELEFKKFNLLGKLKKYSNFNQGYKEYQQTLKEMEDSIYPVNYLLDKYKEILPGTNSNQLLDVLENELRLVKDSWSGRHQSLLYVDVNEQEKEIKQEIHNVQRKIDEMISMSESVSSPKDIYKYQGKLEAKIELYSDKAQPLSYADQTEEIESQIDNLSGFIQEVDSRREFVMGRLNKKINEHLSRLGLKGYSDSEAVFIERDKVVNLVIDNGASIEKMEDIGSASNYLYIHLSFFMALHEVARDNKISWMPAFLVLDQMNTPYSLEDKNGDDVSCFNAALKELDKFVTDMEMKGGFQIILLEHIEESHWTDLKLVKFRLVDKELRGDYGLII